ncbi:MAG: hypothetical protein PHR83_08840 [Paludibacter sp.]|nr:hypothetical protein [Paludibacter sp.]
MKTKFYVILIVLVAIFYSCEKNAVSQDTNTSITSDGVLKGTIVNYASAAIDSVKVFDYDNSSFGNSSVTTEGKFSMILSIPKLSTIGNGPEGTTVSDTNALGNSIFNIYLYKNRKITGELIRCNFTSDSLKTLGMSYSRFLYVDRTTTIKGVQTLLGRWVMSGYVDTLKYVFNATLNKGWNELVFKIEKLENTKMGVTTTWSLTNNIPSDLQWRYFKSSIYSGVKQKAKGQKELVSFDLFGE